MSKKIKLQQQPSGTKRIKQPEAPPPVSYDQMHPIFSLEHLDGEYCVSKCDKDEKLAFLETLRILSQLDWKTIRQAGKHQNGYERIARNCIRGRVPRKFTDDVEHFIAFRFHGMKPMVGHKENHVFYVIWLDRDFTLYDHG